MMQNNICGLLHLHYIYIYIYIYNYKGNTVGKTHATNHWCYLTKDVGPSYLWDLFSPAEIGYMCQYILYVKAQGKI
jgi:hypothetical protein